MEKYIIAGLGNPGKNYKKNRHNAGFIIMDYIKDKIGLKLKKTKYLSKTQDKNIWNSRVYFLKPQTYMNDSGRAIYECANKEGIEPQNILIIYDDIDLSFGTIRFRKSGSAGTHNGMKSIVEHLGTKDFMRLRIGIGEPDKEKGLIKYVLSDFSKEEIKMLNEDIAKTSYEKIKEIVEENKKEGFNVKIIKDE